jgi:hypothetical protein
MHAQNFIFFPFRYEWSDGWMGDSPKLAWFDEWRLSGSACIASTYLSCFLFLSLLVDFAFAVAMVFACLFVGRVGGVWWDGMGRLMEIALSHLTTEPMQPVHTWDQLTTNDY